MIQEKPLGSKMFNIIVSYLDDASKYYTIALLNTRTVFSIRALLPPNIIDRRSLETPRLAGVYSPCCYQPMEHRKQMVFYSWRNYPDSHISTSISSISLNAIPAFRRSS